MTRKPLRTPLHVHESLPSYISRVAGLYCAPDAATFVSWFGANFKEVCAGSQRDLEKISEILDCEPETMRDRVAFGHGITGKLNGHLFPREYVRAIQDRVCLHCLADDEDHGTGQKDLRPYGRMTWMISLLQACPRHKVTLHRLPSIPWKLGDDFHKRLGVGWRDILASEIVETTPTPLDEYIVARFEGTAHRPTWLDCLPLTAALRLCDAMGAETRREDRMLPGEMARAKRVSDGFARISESEEQFMSEIAAMIERGYPRRRFTAISIFAELPSDFVRDMHHEEFSRACFLMREAALRVLPLGPGDDVFAPITKRKFHSAITAGRALEIPASLIRMAIANGKAAQRANGKSPDMFDAALLEELRVKFSADKNTYTEARARFRKMLQCERFESSLVESEPDRSVAISKAKPTLRTNTDVIWSLANDGHLPIFKAEKPKPHWRVPIKELEEFRRIHMSRIELSQCIQDWRKLGRNHRIEDFVPIISKAEVGEDFYDRIEISQ